MTAGTDATGPDPAYRRLPTEGSLAPDIGAALITWVEPMPEHARGYNRWYEDDHFITGAMSMPWMFSGRRYVSPTFLHALRGPVGSTIAEPLEAGKYISLYWINTDRLDDHEQWSLGTNYRLHDEGRGSYRGVGFDPREERRQVFTAFHHYRGATYRDGDVPRDVHTLIQPYKGLVVELIRAAGGHDRDALDRWLVEEHLPKIVTGPVPVTLRFEPKPLPPDRLSHVPEVDGADRTVTVLHFLDEDPRECWEGRFDRTEALLGESGIGELGIQAAFIPTNHGTDDYTDQLF